MRFVMNAIGRARWWLHRKGPYTPAVFGMVSFFFFYQIAFCLISAYTHKISVARKRCTSYLNYVLFFKKQQQPL